MPKYNLDETWKLCLKMWEWIKEQIEGSERPVGALKINWLIDNNLIGIACSCFFCEYTLDEEEETDCERCPGRLVDPDFDCENNEYHYYSKPLDFHKKLLELDKKRIW